jgi:hypothetical protein
MKRDNHAFINYGKLYINGVEYRPPPDGPMMRFRQPGNPEPHMRFAFPLLETRETTINRTGKQEGITSGNCSFTPQSVG